MKKVPQVEITKVPAVTGQFGKGPLSYQNAKKASSTLAAGSVGALALAVTAVVMSGSPKKEEHDRASQFLGVQIPPSQSDPSLLRIPRVDASQPIKPSTPGVDGRQGVRAAKLLGPEVISPSRQLSIPPGAMVDAVLISGASDGLVKAALKEPLIIAGKTLLDSSAVLIGRGQSTDERLMVRFRRAVFPDGTTASVNAEAADADDKIPGLKGSRIGYRALRLAAGIGLNFVGGLSEGLQDQTVIQGAAVNKADMKNALLNGAARASISEGQNVMNELHDEKPIIQIEMGRVITIVFSDSE